MIVEEDISLIPVGPELKRAFALSRDALRHALGLELPDGWPQFPEAFDPQGPSPTPPWGSYLFVVGDGVVGNGGFAGPPNAGSVEIGYEIAPAHWNRGYATAAARSLVELARANGAIRVVACSAAEWNASNRVMAKLGMWFVEALPNAELGTVWRFAVDVPSPDVAGAAK